MKKILIIIIMVLVLLTGCNNKNGNDVSKLETTIYKLYDHNEIEINNAVEEIVRIFKDTDSFYHASLLTIEYGKNNPLEKEKIIKEESLSYDVLYLTLSFKTGYANYDTMLTNHLYEYEAYLVKQHENDDWHVYSMNSII